MREPGLSLLECLVSITVLGVLLGAGLPGLRAFALDARRTADINAFVRAVQLARSESAKTGLEVTLCPSANAMTCGDAGTEFDQGWIVLRPPAGQPVAAAATEPPLLAYRPRIAGSIRANRKRFVFRPNYRRSTNGTVSFCDSRGAQSARAVILSYTGRPRVADRGPGGTALQCPAQ